jgi:hypothetical protein
MRGNEIPSPILITGAARSGSSMVAGIMRICGAFGGKCSGATENRGVNENDFIHDKMIIPFLRNMKADSSGQYPLPNVVEMSIPADWQRRIIGTLTNQNYRKGQGPWFYKGSKSILIWPVWNYAFPNAKWIIVRRRTGDIIRSCLETWHMKAFEDQRNQKAVGARNQREGWLWWIRQHEKRINEMIQSGLNCKVVWPERMVNGDYEQIYEAIEWCGLDWKNNTQRILQYIDPKLWKARNRNGGNGNGKNYSGDGPGSDNNQPGNDAN